MDPLFYILFLTLSYSSYSSCSFCFLVLLDLLFSSLLRLFLEGSDLLPRKKVVGAKNEENEAKNVDVEI